jgi:hypothetical protein
MAIDRVNSCCGRRPGRVPKRCKFLRHFREYLTRPRCSFGPKRGGQIAINIPHKMAYEMHSRRKSRGVQQAECSRIAVEERWCPILEPTGKLETLRGPIWRIVGPVFGFVHRLFACVTRVPRRRLGVHIYRVPLPACPAVQRRYEHQRAVAVVGHKPRSRKERKTERAEGVGRRPADVRDYRTRRADCQAPC